MNKSRLLFSLIIGLSLFLLSIFCSGNDWFDSETHADLLYSSWKLFKEIPYFSFFFNGGTFFLQDPESILHSPTAVFVLFAGPTLGLRISIFIWGSIGAYSYTSWLSTRFGEDAARIGAASWVLSLGFAWRLVVGNDMFVWNLGLPLFLLLIERVCGLSCKSSIAALGFYTGFFILGPTFHSLFYFVIPVVTIWVFFVLLSDSKFGNPRPLLLTLANLMIAAVIGLGISSFKLKVWLDFSADLKRPVSFDNVVSFYDALCGLFDFSIVRHSFIPLTQPSDVFSWGIEESAVALLPIGLFFFVIGLVRWLRKYNLQVRSGPIVAHSIASFGLILVVISLALSCSPVIWLAIKNYTKGNFRVAERFMEIGAFGTALMSTYGAQWAKASANKIVAFVVLTFCAWAYCAHSNWPLTAGTPILTKNFSEIKHQIFSEWQEQTWRKPLNLVPISPSPTGRVPGLSPRRWIQEGFGVSDGFPITGGDWDPYRFAPSASLPIKIETSKNSAVDAYDVAITPTSITVHHLKPGKRILLRLKPPSQRFETNTLPTSINVFSQFGEGAFLIENKDHRILEKWTLQVNCPYSPCLLVLSALISLITCIYYFKSLKNRKSNRS